MSTSDGSYQKLTNEDTLSTFSFNPSLVTKEKSSKFKPSRSWAWVALFVTIVTVLLLKVTFFTYISYFYKPINDISARPLKPVSDYDFDDSCFTAKPTTSDYEDSVAAILHKALVSAENPKNFNDSVPLSVAKISYKTCLHDNQKRWDLDEMISTVMENVLTKNSMEEIANNVGMFWTFFNVETFFKFSVRPNYQNPEDNNSFLIYVEPNADFAQSGAIQAPALSHKILLLRRERRTYQQARLLAEAINDLARLPTDSSKWQLLSLESAKSFDFNFTALFKTMLQDQENMDYRKVQFVVTSPEYVQNLGLLIRTASSDVLKELFKAQLQTSFEDDFDDCVRAINKYTPHIASLLYMSKLNDTEVRLIRQNFDTVFDLLGRFTVNTIAPYLSNNAELTFIRQRIAKLGLTTEQPDWLQLNSARETFDNVHKGLAVPPSTSWLNQLLRFRRFAVTSELKFLTETDVLRDMPLSAIPQTSTKVTYSRVGNWLSVPVAAMLRFEYSDKIDLLMEIATELVRSIDADSFRWTAYGLQQINKDTIHPVGLEAQEKCFQNHHLAQIDYPVYAAANATFSTLIVVDPSPFASGNLANDILEAIVTHPKTISRQRVAAAWAVRNNMETCNTINVLNCFKDV